MPDRPLWRASGAARLTWPGPGIGVASLGHDPHRAPVLAHDERHLRAALAQLLQQRADVLGLRHDEQLTRERLDRVLLTGMERRREVAQRDEARRPVGVVEDGRPGVARDPEAKGQGRNSSASSNNCRRPHPGSRRQGPSTCPATRHRPGFCRGSKTASTSSTLMSLARRASR